MKKALVVGGGSGIGLAVTLKLVERGYDHVYIAGKDAPDKNAIPCGMLSIFEEKTSFTRVNLINDDVAFVHGMEDVDTLILTAGFGRVAPFEELSSAEINNLVKCNMLSAMQIIKHFYKKMKSAEPFYCAVMGSIAGHVASPLFSVYGASKFGLCSLIENLNIELAHDGAENRILDVSPGSLKGTKFHGGRNDIAVLSDFADELLARMYRRDTLFIPMYEDVYADVLRRYRADPMTFGCESYDYKIQQGRASTKQQVVVGYLSGTFDLFHVGHLNLLRRAKEQCDYLIVGVHKSGSWKGKETFIPFEERLQIVASIQYVDRAIQSYTEDSDAYDALHFDKLFVGSDYKGTERFARYEAYFADKGVEIVYFPYTQGTSSTQLRDALKKETPSK